MLEFRKIFPGKKMTEKPELEKDAYGDIIEPPFDPKNIPSFDPMQEFADRGQLHQRGNGYAIGMKKETPVEKIEREERDRLFSETIMKERAAVAEKEKNQRNRY